MAEWACGRARSADKYWFLRDSSTERARQHDAAPIASKQAAGQMEALALQGTSCPSCAKSSRSTALLQRRPQTADKTASTQSLLLILRATLINAAYI